VSDAGPAGRAAVPSLAPPTAADAIVVGGGVAGLAAALAMRDREVLLVSKRELGGGGASNWAQGGVAVALGANDSPAKHAADTVAVAGGIADRIAVEMLTTRGPQRIRELLARGARFDRDDAGELLFGREAAHSTARILHAGGDATGAEMVRALAEAVRLAPWVRVLDATFVEELLVEDGRIVGLLVRELRGEGSWRVLAAPAVVLATGGIGQAWRYTTNPVEATGDGLAMAARAGALLADVEFMQFHPTALAGPRDPLPLLTEALRGEGAVLLDARGKRFMLDEHPLAELAPRDIVARAIFRRRKAGEEIVLDAREAVGDRFPQRFPTVFARCQEQGFDPRIQPLPVTPAAHYHMGGVATDLRGRASIPGLWACGEVASTGVHGANRLASNSLLEALVFGAEVGEDVVRLRPSRADSRAVRALGRRLVPAVTPAADLALRGRVRQILWEGVGVERDGAGLQHALLELGSLAATPGAQAGELRNLIEVGRLVAAAALQRHESRGAHWRRDFPAADPRAARRTVSTATDLLQHAGDRRPLVASLG